MKNLIYVLMAFLLVSISGCSVAEWAVSDIAGWNLSACISGYDTCLELFWDNMDKFPDVTQIWSADLAK